MRKRLIVSEIVDFFGGDDCAKMSLLSSFACFALLSLDSFLFNFAGAGACLVVFPRMVGSVRLLIDDRICQVRRFVS